MAGLRGPGQEHGHPGRGRPDNAKRATVFEAQVSALDIEDRGYTVKAIIKQAERDERLQEALAEVASGKDKPLDGYRLGNWFSHNRNRMAELESGGRLKLVMVPSPKREWMIERRVKRDGADG
jgi:hypothetical protein